MLPASTVPQSGQVLVLHHCRVSSMTYSLHLNMMIRQMVSRGLVYPLRVSRLTYTAPAVAMAVFSATIAFASARPSRVEHVEARIKELQAKLHITPTQEALWQNVTQIMRDNAQTMDGLTQARIDKAKTMTAVDNLQSYSVIVEAHAEGLKK